MDGIRLIRRKELDTAAWDRRVADSNRPLVYGLSWYLDAMTDGHWEALVYGNYEAVFPIPFMRKWGLPVAFQPFFCQQLGLFAKDGFRLGYDDFLKAIPSRFVRVHLQLNAGHVFPSGLKTRCNLLLDLNRDYESIRSGYTEDAQKNLRRGESAGVICIETHDFQSVIALYQKVYGPMNPVLTERHYRAFGSACAEAGSKGMLLVLQSECEGRITGGAIFLKNHRYLHYVCAAPDESAKKTGGMHNIIDHVIRMHAGQPVLLDFEGSELPAVAAFYRKFGPEEERYGVYERRLF